MDRKLRFKLANYIVKIANDTTIDDMVKELVEIEKSHSDDPAEGLKFYENLLKMLKPERAPNVPYINILDEDEMPKIVDEQ